ncbi:hypothetical protein ACFOWE_12260 [Planomonospora corallina]|uniref:Uncharacterized protein n=1 Tax=Planomonospora corallina TaxID=1806052 RepID=A0ABV8I591_9ACTN
MSKKLMRIASTGIAAAALVLSAPSVAMASGGWGWGGGGCGYGCGGWGGGGWGGGGNGAFYSANQSLSGPYGASNYHINTGTGGGLFW